MGGPGFPRSHTAALTSLARGSPFDISGTHTTGTERDSTLTAWSGSSLGLSASLVHFPWLPPESTATERQDLILVPNPLLCEVKLAV